MLSILCVRLTIKVKVGIPESLKVGWYPPKKKLGRVTLSSLMFVLYVFWGRRSFIDPICRNFCVVLSMFYRLVLANFLFSRLCG